MLCTDGISPVCRAFLAFALSASLTARSAPSGLGFGYWLLEHAPCDVNHQNRAGQTALMMASLFGREAIVELLLEHAAKPDLADHQGNTTEKPAQAQGLSRVAEIIKFHIRDLNVFATNYIFNGTITVN